MTGRCVCSNFSPRSAINREKYREDFKFSEYLARRWDVNGVIYVLAIGVVLAVIGMVVAGALFF